MSELLKVREYGVAAKIEKEPLPDKKELEELIAKINQYIGIMEVEAAEHLMKNRDESHVTYYQTLDFFRSNERLQNTKHILQYLIKFLEAIPSKEISEKMFQNPFEQFRGFVVYFATQLREPDVIDSVLREYKELKLLNQKTEWYYRGIIRSAYKEINGICKMPMKGSNEDYGLLFKALKKHSIFWFSIRRENLDRIRKSDIFIYRLCRILLNKYKLKN